MRKCIGSRFWLVTLLCGLLATPAAAEETTTYTYDAKGRVIGVVRTGGPNNGVNTSYSYDAADNRTNVTVTNSPNGNSNGYDGATVDTTRFVVVPLLGGALIFIR